MKQKLIHFYFETTTEVFVLKTRPVSCFSDFLQQNSHIDSCVKLALRKGWKSDMQTWRQWTHSNWLMNVLVFASTQRRGTVDGPVVTRHKTCFQQRRDYSFNDCLHNTTNPLVSYLFHSGIWTWRKEEIQYEIIISSELARPKKHTLSGILVKFLLFKKRVKITKLKSIHTKIFFLRLSKSDIIVRRLILGPLKGHCSLKNLQLNQAKT